MRQPIDRYLPPDHAAFVAAEPPTGRVIVIAPTRAACETIELAVGLHLDTYLEQHHGARVRELARGGQGFGIVAGTGTGKTLAIRPIAEEIVGTPLRVGVINREREATPETRVSTAAGSRAVNAAVTPGTRAARPSSIGDDAPPLGATTVAVNAPASGSSTNRAAFANFAAGSTGVPRRVAVTSRATT